MQVKHLLLIAIFALTAACSSNETVDENLGEVELYQQAQADLDNKSCRSNQSKRDSTYACFNETTSEKK